MREEVHFGTYDCYPCCWIENYKPVLDGWLYVDAGYWNPIKLRLKTIRYRVHALTAAAFRSDYPDLEPPPIKEVSRLWASEPFVALAKALVKARRQSELRCSVPK